MVRSLRAILTPALFLALAGLVGAQTVTFPAVDSHSFQYKSYESPTWSSSTTSSLTTDYFYFPGTLGRPGSTTLTRWAAEFDLSGLAAGRKILSATFVSNVSAFGFQDPSHHIVCYQGDGAVTLDDVLKTTGERRFFGGLGEVRIDVTRDVKGLVDAGGRIFGAAIGTRKRGLGVWSAPVLAITYVPIATFTSLGSLETAGFFSSARALSADGTTVVGVSDSATGDRAFVWTAARGLFDIGTGAATATGVSGDGRVVVGASAPAGAFRWVENGTGTYLGANAIAGGISSDGGVVVGSSLAPNGERQVFRWSAANTSRFPTYVGKSTVPAHAVAVSADGSVFVGSTLAVSPLAAPRAFVWNANGGQFALPLLPGGKAQSEALGVSADGTVVVGWARGMKSPEAFRWTQAGGIVGLGNLKNPNGTLGNASRANAVSADGKIVVGAGVSGGKNRAFVWDAGNGMQSLQDLLAAKGSSDALAGWTLFDATGVTVLADGTVVVTGTGYDPQGRTQAFHAVLPDLTPPTTSPTIRP